MDGCGRGKAIYPVVIIVIVALNWSPIDHGFTDATHLAGGDVRSSTHPDLNRATLSTGTVITPIAVHMARRSVQGDEEALEAETKQGSLGI